MGYIYNSLHKVVESVDISFDYSKLDLIFQSDYSNNHLVSQCGKYSILVSWSCMINHDVEFMFSNNDCDSITTLDAPTYNEFIIALCYKLKYPPAIKILRDSKIDGLLK